jgi:hypothetical protein
VLKARLDTRLKLPQYVAGYSSVDATQLADERSVRLRDGVDHPVSDAPAPSSEAEKRSPSILGVGTPLHQPLPAV